MNGNDNVEEKNGNDILENNENQGSNESKDESEFKFDPNAFMQDSDNESSLSTEDEQNANESNSESSNDSTNDNSDSDNTNDDFSWDNTSGSADNQDSQSQEEESQARADGNDTDETSNNDLERNAQSDEESQNANSDSLDYTSLASRLGVEDSTPEKIHEQIDLLMKENEDLKQYRTQGINNEKIDNYSKLKKLSNEDLVRESLKADRLSDEDIDKQMELFESNDVMQLEANKVRRVLDGAISREQVKEEEKAKKIQEQEIVEDQENKGRILEALNSTDTMFGMKMTQNPDKLDGVRQEHFKYITEGDFAKEIGADPKNIMEIAWLWKHREGILSQMTSQGQNKARKEMVNMFENVQPNSTSSGTLPPNPSDKGSIFDPSKFTGAK